MTYKNLVENGQVVSDKNSFNFYTYMGGFKKNEVFFKTDLQQTQNGFQMWFLYQNMCLANVEIAGKFQVNICIRYKSIAL